MESHRKRRLYEVTAVILGFSLVIALTTTVYAHLWLGEFPGENLPHVFTDTAEDEQPVMEELRRLGAVGSVILLALGAILSRRYVQFIASPRWEAKKALTAGLFVNLTGILFYLVATGLFIRALYLSLVFLTGLVVVVLGALLVLTADSDEEAEPEPVEDEPHCGQCGTNVTETIPYCPECGTELR